MNRMRALSILSAMLLATPVAMAANRIPDRLPNGERPWPEPEPAETQRILAALPGQAPAKPAQQRRLLVFYRTDGFPHSSIPYFNKLFVELGRKTGAYTATLTQSYHDLSADSLKGYDAVFLNNTCRMNTPASVKAALQGFVKGGKGLAGNHGAGDNWQDWPEGLEMLGARFVCHPYGRVQVKVDDPQSPLTAVFGGKPFPFQDEIYAFKEPYSRVKLRVLLSIDYPGSPDVPKAEAELQRRAAAPEAKPSDKEFVAAARPDHDYAIAWIRRWGEGRVFYCSLGHVHEATWNPAIVRFYLAGIQYALGDLKTDDTPSQAIK